ncbi:MAG: hypothetical protein GY723_15270 [bacterium]|nr:hypothetical protein [bacterium]
MRKAIVLLLLGLLALVIEGALATGMSVRFIPQASLLAAVAAGLVLRPGEGLVVAALLGLGADALSGTLLGQQAMLRILEVVATRGIAAQLDLRNGFPLVFFVFAIALVDAALLVTGSWFFLGLSFHGSEVGGVLVRAVVTGLCAPAVSSLAQGLVERLDESQARREMRLETGRPAL